MRTQRADEVIELIEEKIEEIENLILELPIKSSVKGHLVRALQEVQQQTDDALDLTPADWD